MKENFSKKTKVAVGLSGGVDSSVAALLLKEAGCEVTGIFLTCWDGGVGCSTEQDRKDAVAVAAQIGIPIKVWDFQREYKRRVIDRFYKEYKRGRTPNPDIWCNEEIKFGLFLERALKQLGVDYIATGHYARIEDRRWHHLLTGLDPAKDQSYFLYRLNQFQLSHSLFPLGHLTKQKVREIAKQNNLLTAKKPDSQGICFVGRVDLREFLKKRIDFHKGAVVNADGRVIGEHDGVEFYTIGQRHGFRLAQQQGAPLYVIKKDIQNNQLVVGRGEESEVGGFEVEDVHWIKEDREWKVEKRVIKHQNNYSNLKPQTSKRGYYPSDSTLHVRIRHLGELLPCRVKTRGSNLVIYLTNPTRGVAPGQHAVFYLEGGEWEAEGGKGSGGWRVEAGKSFEVLGGGVIKQSLKLGG